jgi:hypothetical protein
LQGILDSLTYGANARMFMSRISKRLCQSGQRDTLTFTFLTNNETTLEQSQLTEAEMQEDLRKISDKECE